MSKTVKIPDEIHELLMKNKEDTKSIDYKRDIGAVIALAIIERVKHFPRRRNREGGGQRDS